MPLGGDTKRQAGHRFVEVIGTNAAQWLGGGAKLVGEKNPRPAPFPTPWVDEHALGCNGVQCATTGNESYPRISSDLGGARNCTALHSIALETTVNRLVAGSNPARGAKPHQALRTISEPIA